MAAQVKRTYLDRTTVSGLIAECHSLHQQTRRPRLLIARYIPGPTGERLAAAGINFVDAAGNVHLDLGDGVYRSPIRC